MAFNDELADALGTYARIATPLRLLAGIQESHRRGAGAIRFVPYISAVGTWRLEIAARHAVNDQGQSPAVRPGAHMLRYSSADGSDFAGGRVTGATPVGAVADLIIAGLRDVEQGVRSAAYKSWLDGLLDTCTVANGVPYAFDDDDSTDGATWWVTGSPATVPAPPRADRDA